MVCSLSSCIELSLSCELCNLSDAGLLSNIRPVLEGEQKLVLLARPVEI